MNNNTNEEIDYYVIAYIAMMPNNTGMTYGDIQMTYPKGEYPNRNYVKNALKEDNNVNLAQITNIMKLTKSDFEQFCR